MPSEHGIKVAAGILKILPEEYRAKRAAGVRWCSGHRDWTPAEQFGRRTGRCRPCAVKASLEWRAAHADDYRDYMREYQRARRRGYWTVRP